MSQLPSPALPWPIPIAAVALIAQSEGCRLRAYRCPAGIPTIGWGETDGVRMGDVCTQDQADQWLLEDLQERTRKVAALCAVSPGGNELGAMVSLAYNIGLGAFAKSTVLKAHNAGDHQAAGRAFGLWNKARVGGALTVLAGLTSRRAREAALYLTPEEVPDVPSMPQAVAAESAAAGSPILQGGATTAGVGVVAALTEARGSLGPVGEAVGTARSFLLDTLGLPAEWLLPALLIAVGAVVVRWRLRQRSEGWA